MLQGAEIIPFEPDAGHTDEGNKKCFSKESRLLLLMGQISINGKVYNLDTAEKLMTVLSNADIHSFEGVAVAVNQTIISKKEWENFYVKNNDKIIIVKATQGG